VDEIISESWARSNRYTRARSSESAFENKIGGSFQNERGFVTKYVYDVTTGKLTQRVDDTASLVAVNPDVRELRYLSICGGRAEVPSGMLRAIKRLRHSNKFKLADNWELIPSTYARTRTIRRASA